MQSSQNRKVTMCFKFDTCNTISVFINELPQKGEPDMDENVGQSS
jgi:hypothetical protein